MFFLSGKYEGILSLHDSEVSPILVCRTDAIGDLVLTTPVFRKIRERWPDVKMDALVSRTAAPVLQGNPHVNNVLVDPGRTGDRIRLIRSGRYKTAIIVRPEPGIAWAVWRVGIPVRIGTGRRLYSPLFSHTISKSRKHGTLHEAEHNVGLLTPLGISPGTPWAEVFLHDEEKEEAILFLKQEGVPTDSHFVVVHPGSHGSAPNLPYSTYAELCLKIMKQYPLVITGSRDETAPLMETLGNLGEYDHPCLDLGGRTSLRQLMAILSLAGVVVASSTGPLHLAAASGIPTVSFYPRLRHISAKRWAPWVEPSRKSILNPPRESCLKSCKGYCGRDGCMTAIQASEIFRTVEKVLSA